MTSICKSFLQQIINTNTARLQENASLRLERGSCCFPPFLLLFLLFPLPLLLLVCKADDLFGKPNKSFLKFLTYFTKINATNWIRPVSYNMFSVFKVYFQFFLPLRSDHVNVYWFFFLIWLMSLHGLFVHVGTQSSQWKHNFWLIIHYIITF